MDDTSKNLPDRIVFIADAHLGMPDESQARVETVATFIRGLRGNISHLYIVGDMFDFWFEYSSVVPNIAPHVIFELYNLVQSGTEVTLFAGNHDYWLGHYLQNDVGVTIKTDEAVISHQGFTLYLHHGDGLYPHDYGYRLLKKVLRNKISVFLFRLLHPDFARWLALLTSKLSRAFFAPPMEAKDIERFIHLFRDIADRRLNEGYEAVIYGHSHIPLIEQRQNGTMILLGDWITHNTYIVLEKGEFSIHSWKS